VYRGRKTIPLPHAVPGTNFHYANRTRARANPAPSTPAGWLCVAWLEGFGVDDVLVVEDTTEAGLRVLVGVVVVPGLVDVVDVDVVRGVVSVVAVDVGTIEEVSVGVEEVSVGVDVSEVDEAPVAEAVEVPVAPLQRDKKNASAACMSAASQVVERH